MLPVKILYATSTIADGNMSFRFGNTHDVIANRQAFLKKHNIPFENHICMRCNHGEKIIAVNCDNRGKGAQTPDEMIDAEVLVTQEKHLALMLLTADCIPGIFYDPVQEVIALAHLNRKTAAYNLGEETVRFLIKEFQSNPSDLLVHFGPYIHRESYSFALPLSEETPLQLVDFIEEKDGRAYIDMKAAFLHQLAKAGVAKEQVTMSDIDTAASLKHFSHYRSQTDPSYPNGRLATIVMMQEE